jgi:prophage DNA circulation protein
MDIHNPWRDALMPASFRGAEFHVEVGNAESGRRIVVHEFPKRDVPYAEDMGRRAVEFSVRAYCISFPSDMGGVLYRRDYRIARDRLGRQLETEGPGILQLPLLKPMAVVCQRYRLTEEQKAGGYCSFDIQFVESGNKLTAQVSSRDRLIGSALAMVSRVTKVMNGQI